ncbi:tetratricopeptide repeat protein [Luteimonas yindakuii]|uniref:Tetratricopeptide repeat protein n=1 Tax=Luteimonas yindakuii TaxID=2565782 RepID=A0A4Z1R7Y0_9GAMM|nr:serine/threonine-protein kinase [Luteimonas yindakuii]TKS55066.1 tetratricopeptide repeat protein [Luteimonas yindakuii]
MDAARWQQVSAQLDALLDLELPRRSALLARIRAEDPALAAELDRLLALEHTDSPLDTPLVAPLPGARPGLSVGPYRLEHLLGEGGMGQVWLARRDDGLYQRRVALKLLRPGLADPGLRLRFTRERQILARLEHAHIARLLDAGISADQQPYLALDYVDGEPITDWCTRRDAGIEECLQLFLQVCDAVSHAHANLIVHRDLKPSNILVTPLDDVRLLDFGIAKLLDAPEPAVERTRTGLRAFTLHYAAPEQIRGEPVTTMTDVYSLGMVLYELIAGAKPYALKRPSDAQWEEAILGIDPPRPSAVLQRRADEAAPHGKPALRRRARRSAGDLDNIVLKALAKRPGQRYPSVEAFALDLQRYLDGRPVLARPHGLLYRTRKYVRRHRWPLATAAAITVVLALALAILGWQRAQAQRETDRARAMQALVVGLFEHAGSARAARPLDVRELLDAGQARGAVELAGQPGLHAELLGVLARLRLGLGDYARALDLLDRQAALIDEAGDVPASLRLEASANRGRALRLLGRPADCIARMDPARALAHGSEGRLPAQAAEYYAQLGRCRRQTGEMASAEALFRHALALRRGRAPLGPGVAENLADLASLHAARGHTAAARRGYQSALAELQRGMGARHPLAIDILRALCAVERDGGRIAQAERHCADAVSLAQALHGSHHPDTIDARRLLAALHVDQGRLTEAETEFREAHAWLLARLGPDHVDVARNLNSLAIVAWERGDTAAALRDLDAATAMLAARGPSHGLADVMFNLALVRADSGDAQAALPSLEESLALRRELLGDDHPLIGVAQRLRGELLLRLGRDADALVALRDAARLTRAGYGGDHPQARRAEHALALAEARGDPQRALQRLDPLAAAEAVDLEARKAAWLAGASAAALRCTGGDVARGQRDGGRIAGELRSAFPEGGSVRRQATDLLSPCGTLPDEQAGAASRAAGR